MLAITENSEGETRRRFQFCIERLQGLGRLFLQLPARSIRSLERGGARDRPGALLAGVGCAPRLPGRRESVPPAYRNGLAKSRFFPHFVRFQRFARQKISLSVMTPTPV